MNKNFVVAGVMSVASFVFCFGRLSSPVFAQGAKLANENGVYCKLAATVTNGNNVSVTVIPTNVLGQPVPMPAGYTYSNTASVTDGVNPNPIATIALSNGQGNATLTVPGWLSINSSLVGSDGNVVTCTAARVFITVAPTNYIDMALKREFLSQNQNLYKFKVTVSNYGNSTVSNFKVKDYLPSNAILTFAQGATNNLGVVTWTIPSLAAGQSKVFIIEMKKTNEGVLRTKGEVCNYEGMNSNVSPRDLDSNPCNMGANGAPSQDDEAALTN